MPGAFSELLSHVDRLMHLAEQVLGVVSALEVSALLWFLLLGAVAGFIVGAVFKTLMWGVRVAAAVFFVFFALRVLGFL